MRGELRHNSTAQHSTPRLLAAHYGSCVTQDSRTRRKQKTTVISERICCVCCLRWLRSQRIYQAEAGLANHGRSDQILLLLLLHLLPVRDLLCQPVLRRTTDNRPTFDTGRHRGCHNARLLLRRATTSQQLHRIHNQPAGDGAGQFVTGDDDDDVQLDQQRNKRRASPRRLVHSRVFLSIILKLVYDLVFIELV